LLAGYHDYGLSAARQHMATCCWQSCAESGCD